MIFRGLKQVGKYSDCTKIVRGFCNEVLGASKMVYINRGYLLGKYGSAIIAISKDTDIEYVTDLEAQGDWVCRQFEPRWSGW